jgi:hypothetical protein
LLGAIVGSYFGPRPFGQVMGIMYPIVNLSILGSVLMGGIRDRTGSYDAALIILIVALAPAALLMQLLKARPQSEPPASPSLDHHRPPVRP